MASYQQVCYCKKCKTNVGLNEKGQCKRCGSTQITKTWSVRFRYVNEQQKEVQKRLCGFGTKRECQTEYEKFIATAKQYVKLENEAQDLLFSTLYEEYKAFQKPRIKESSYFSLCTKCDLHIKPYFEKFKVKNITPKIILDWQMGLEKYSYKHKTNLRAYLAGILKYAERYYQIQNQIKYVDAFKKTEKPKEMLIWSPKEFLMFITKVTDIRYKTFFYALYYTGSRKGEMLATQWKDWDLDNKILNIDKTITKKTFDNHLAITSPKNFTSIRKISLPNSLIQLMKEFKSQYYKDNDLDFVFPLSETSIRRHKKEACKLSEIKEIRIHDFRHTHASLLISCGISIVGVAKRLGHANIEQTLNTYAHLMESEDKNLLNVLDKSLQF